jgi:mannose-6-phosphate isomerase-like protein (cupin superfamily)
MWLLVMIILIVLAIWISIRGGGLKKLLEPLVPIITKTRGDCYHSNIEKSTLENTNYRKVEYTTSNMQLVLMNLSTGQEIGTETHPDTTQFIRVEKGTGKAIIDKKEYPLNDGVAIVIPPGVEHNIIAATPLKLYTLYSPPEHPNTLVEVFKV